MRIAVYNVTTTLKAGGLETYCREIARTLSGMGVQADLLAGENPKLPRTPTEGSFKIVTFPFRGRETFPWGGTRLRKLMERLSFAREAGNYLAAQAYDAAIIVKPFDFPSLWRVRKKRPLKVLFASGGTDFFPMDRFFSSCVDHFIACSAYNARQIEARYDKPCRVVGYGVDTTRFSPQKSDPNLKEKLGLKEARVLITVGRLVGWKGLHILMEALVEILKSQQEVIWLLAGEGEEEEKLKKMAAKLGILEAIRFLGPVPHRELPGYLNLAQMLIQPSIGEEAFGITIIEAMACGLPVIGTQTGGIPEIIHEGRTGYLVPPGDAKALIERVTALLKDPGRLQKMGLEGRAQVLEKFTWSRVAQAHLELLAGGGKD